MSEKLVGRRRRKSKPKDTEEEEVEQKVVEDRSSKPPVEVKKKRTKLDDSEKREVKQSVVEESPCEQPVALVQSKKKRIKLEESEKREWGSKQPKPVDADVLKYALTTGGEIARKINERNLLEKRKGSEGEDETIQTRLDAANAEITQLRAALFREIKEGEASLACDKRGSRVLQNLVKDGDAENLVPLFERLKPYVGHIVYDSFASHVMQALIDRCSSENASNSEEQYVREFCAQISKANEWWAMMHDTGATYVARSCAIAMAKIHDSEGLDALFNSLKSSAQTDFRSAARSPQGGPFLVAAITSMDTAQAETLLTRLISDERNGTTFDRKQFDSCVQDRVASRVIDQCVSRCGKDFVTTVIFDEGFVTPFLQRSAKHSFANFVVQRVIESLRDASCLERAMEECSVKEMIDFERVGVLKAIAKALVEARRDKAKGVKDLQMKFAQSLLEADALNRATQHLKSGMVVKEVKQDKEFTPAQVHVILAETLSLVLRDFSMEAKRPLIDQLLTVDDSFLLKLACDPVGGKHIIEIVLELKDESSENLVKHYRAHFDKLLMNSFGVHVARKGFDLLSNKDKISVMENSIVPNKSKLQGSVHANKFLSTLRVSQFVANKKEWIKKFDQDVKGEDKKSEVKKHWEADLGL